MQLASLSWKQAEKYISDKTVAIIPVGSVENHGTQSSLGTDYIVPEELAKIIEKKTDVLVLPVMPYGVCPSQLDFPGTINIGYEALLSVMRNIAASLMHYGIRKIIFLNGHGGNDSALDAVALEIYQKGGLAATIDWWSLAPQINPKWLGGHGGGQETAAMMAIHPEWIDLNQSWPFEVKNLSENLVCSSLNLVRFKGANIKVPRDVKDVVPSGWFGFDDPKKATIEWGKEMLEATAEYIAEFIDEFKKVEIDKLKKCEKV